MQLGGICCSILLTLSLDITIYFFGRINITWLYNAGDVYLLYWSIIGWIHWISWYNSTHSACSLWNETRLVSCFIRLDLYWSSWTVQWGASYGILFQLLLLFFLAYLISQVQMLILRIVPEINLFVYAIPTRATFQSDICWSKQWISWVFIPWS